MGCTPNIVIPTGQDGINGQNGVYGGFSDDWFFDTATAGAPASTYLRFDDADPANVTQILINKEDASVNNVSAFLASFDNSGNFGNLRIWKRYNSPNFAMYEVTGVTLNVDVYEIDVVYITHTATFSLDDNVVVSFTDNGAPGIQSAMVEENLIPGASTQSTVPVILGSFTTSGLTTNGSYFKVKIVLDRTDVTANQCVADINIEGTSILPAGVSYIPIGKFRRVIVELTINRIDSSNIYVTLHAVDNDKTVYSSDSMLQFSRTRTHLGVMSTSTDIEILGNVGDVSDTLTLAQLSVTKYVK